MRLIDADKLSQDDEVTEWITRDALRTEKQLKMFSELFLKKVKNAPTVDAVPLSVLEDIKAEIKRASVGKWYIGNVNGKSEEVIPLIDALEIIDSHIKAGDKE